MSLTNYSQMAVIMSLITTVAILTTCGFVGSTQASIISDMNNIMRDISTEMNTMPSPTSTTITTTGTSTTLRQMILRNGNDKKDNNVGVKYASIVDNNDNDDVESDSISYNEPSSAELLRFVNDNDDSNNDFSDISVYSDNSNHNNNKNKNNIVNTINDNYDNEISFSNSKNKYQTIVNSNNDNDNNNDYIESLNLKDQVRLLSKQLNVLMNRRREDYELLERNLRKSLRITEPTTQQHQHQQQQQEQQQSISYDLDLRNELEKLRLV